MGLKVVKSYYEVAMGITNIEYKTFEEMELPEVIYKYRDWNDTFHKRIITEREVFMAAPNSFEDPVDCKLPIEYSGLSKKEIREVCLYNSKLYYPERTRKQHRKYAENWRTESPFGNIHLIKQFQEQMLEKYNSQIGVLSLTANVKNLKMWEKYSNNHKGFAVGFNPTVMFQYLGGGGPVTYYDTLPIVRPAPIHSYDEQRCYQIFSKLSKWSFEEEYRTHIFRSNELTKESRTIQIPAEAYTEIVIGTDMPNDMFEDLLNSIPSELKHVTIKRADKNEMN